MRSAFLRDKSVLVDLFQDVARVELDFLVRSGLGFGFLFGLAQMGVWLFYPVELLLPAAGAVVGARPRPFFSKSKPDLHIIGYATNWVAIKLVFEPIEPVPIPGTNFCVQGLFEKRQPEVSDAFAEFLRKNVLTPRRLLEELVDGENAPKLRALLRRELPFVVPDAIIDAAIGAIRDVAADEDHAVHGYVASALDVERDLSTKLKALPAAEFENLLHPVFQEDELTLILVRGVLGAGCGMGQLALGAAAVAL